MPIRDTGSEIDYLFTFVEERVPMIRALESALFVVLNLERRYPMTYLEYRSALLCFIVRGSTRFGKKCFEGTISLVQNISRILPTLAVSLKVCAFCKSIDCV